MTLFAPRSLLAAPCLLLWPAFASAQTLQTNTGSTSLNQINVTTPYLYSEQNALRGRVVGFRRTQDLVPNITTAPPFTKLQNRI